MTTKTKLEIKKIKELVDSNCRLFTPIDWPEIQFFMEVDGFRDHAYLINDDKGLDDYGSSAYMVDVYWMIENDLI